MPQPVCRELARIVQEALVNVRKHSQARQVLVRLGSRNGAWHVLIEDDGRGFDSEHVKGLGLLGIQERVARLGGKCAVHSAPGRGTVLAVEFPFASPVLSEDMRETNSHSVG